MNTTELLCELLCCSGEKQPYSEFAHRPEFEVLRSLGIVEDAGIMPTIFCDECSIPHGAEIAFDDEQRCYGFICFDQGFIKVMRDDIKAFRVVTSALINQIANALGCRGTRSAPLLAGLLWRVGILELPGDSIAIYATLRSPSANDVQACAAAISNEVGYPRRLLLTPNLDASIGLTIAGCRLASLEQALAVTPTSGLTVDPQKIAHLAGIERRQRTGRPPEFEPMLSELIAKRSGDETARKAVRAESKEIRKIWPLEYPSLAIPSDTVVRDNITDFRAGRKVVGN